MATKLRGINGSTLTDEMKLAARAQLRLASDEPSPQPQAQPAVPPSPVPMTFQVAQVTENSTGQKFAMLSISTSTGTSVYFLDANIARAVGKVLQETASIIASPGLVVP